jgi:hypothetical protein
MDLTIVLVGLLIGVGVPLRNKVIREYRKKKDRNIRYLARSIGDAHIGSHRFEKRLWS